MLSLIFEGMFDHEKTVLANLSFWSAAETTHNDRAREIDTDCFGHIRTHFIFLCRMGCFNYNVKCVLFTCLKIKGIRKKSS